MLQFLGQFTAALIFSNYIGMRIDHLTLDLLILNLQYLTLDFLKSFSLLTIRKKTTMNEILNVRL